MDDNKLIYSEPQSLSRQPSDRWNPEYAAFMNNNVEPAVSDIRVKSVMIL